MLDGRKQDGKVVEIHFLAAMFGQPIITVIPAKKWSDIPEYQSDIPADIPEYQSDIPEYQKDFDDDHLNTNKTFYVLDCVKQTAQPYQIQIHQEQLKQIPLKTVALNQLQNVEKTAADYLCHLLMSHKKSS